MKHAAITSADVDDDLITFRLSDGRVLSAPTAWSTRLHAASAEERGGYEISASGTVVEWPALDEHIGLWTLLGVPEADVLESAGFETDDVALAVGVKDRTRSGSRG